MVTGGPSARPIRQAALADRPSGHANLGRPIETASSAEQHGFSFRPVALVEIAAVVGRCPKSIPYARAGEG
jgi:hypothetical protein